MQAPCQMGFVQQKHDFCPPDNQKRQQLALNRQLTSDQTLIAIKRIVHNAAQTLSFCLPVKFS